jgi:hypothetical protein
MRWASYELPAPVVKPPPCSHTQRVAAVLPFGRHAHAHLVGADRVAQRVGEGLLDDPVRRRVHMAGSLSVPPLQCTYTVIPVARMVSASSSRR